MDFSLLLAQESAVLETAERGLGILERVQAGGVLLIAICVAVICGYAFYWQLKRNNAQKDGELAKSEQREKDKDEATKIRLGEQEGFLREMLDRDRESQEAQLAAVQAVQGITHALNEEKAETAALGRKVEDLLSRVKDIDDFLRRRFRDA